jgi:hypothetical protein
METDVPGFFRLYGRLGLSPSYSKYNSMNSSNRTRFRSLLRRFGSRASGLRLRYGISVSARAESLRERRPETWQDKPPDCVLNEGLAWIGRAQDHSLSADGGVARHYCLVTGWGRSYPETTGYIIPTIIREGMISGDESLLERARKMLDWLVSIQMPCGAFQAGVIGAAPMVPVTFNTGQILLGLAAGVNEFGSAYREAMVAAADWLTETQDSDGCWRKYPTPYAISGDKSYETHSAWGLFEAARLEPTRGYAEAAMRNVDWALSQQSSNGWFANCCLTDPQVPLTHTIGYVLRGLVEAYQFTGDRNLLQKACKTAEGALQALRADGFLPGRINCRWKGAASWCCLTGTAQIAICWLLLYAETGDVRFHQAALAANRYARHTVRLEGPPETRGAVKGSFPVSGDYLQFRYPNWACKFLIDAMRLEMTVSEEKREPAVPLSVRAAGLTH